MPQPECDSPQQTGTHTPTAVQRSVDVVDVVVRRRFFRRLLAIACALLIVAVFGVHVYVQPQTDPLRPADAVLVLGGYGDSRYRTGIELGLQGWAPVVVVSNPQGAADVWAHDYCASPPTGLQLHCFIPNPPTTKGEGRELRRLASEHGWHRVIVVTFRPHISRARFIMEQCFPGELVMVASPEHISLPRWLFEYVYQSAGYVRAALQPGC